MTRFLGSIGIHSTIYLLVALPLLALTGVGGWQAWSSWRTASEMQQLQALAELAPSVSGVVHELQKERGASAVFISGRGQNNAGPRLTSQRTQTDGALSSFNEALEGINPTDYGDAFTTGIREARTALAKLDQERNAIDSFDRKTAEMARFYTATIRDLLDVIGHMPALSQNAKVTSAIDGYIALLEAKERAGVERAMGAAGFAGGSFSTELHRRLVDLIGQQRAYLAVFNSHATAEQAAFYQRQLSGPTVNDVERLRKIAIDSPVSGDLQDISGATWFEATTKRINLLKGVEDRLSADLVSLAQGLRAEAQSAFWLQAGFLLVLTITLVVLGAVIANNISEPVVKLTKAITTLARGDQNIGELPSKRADEIGAMSRALADLRLVSIEAIRGKTGMDSASTCFIIAKQDQHAITYLNDAMRRMLQQEEADFRQSVPGFSAGSLEGSNLQAFLASGRVEDGKIVDFGAPQSLKIMFGRRTYRVNVTPIIASNGSCFGTVAEWHDLTEEAVLQKTVAGLLEAVDQGDFSRRIDTGEMRGVLGELGDGVNRLTGLVEGVSLDLGRVLQALAEGDLTQRITADYRGTLGELKENANRTAEQLSGIVSQIQTATSEMDNAASEISSGTSDLSDRTEQAASNLEETAASTEQMSATVRQNAESAKSASQLAEAANQTASKGGNVVEQAVGAMSAIDESAQKITDIISVIDEIAFQTNLLALNASVEAARAGEAGKGFAVVAQEVRQLAQRSSHAADDIKGLIQHSNGQVKEGVQLVDQAGKALTEIVGSIGKVTGIVSEISNASQEQAIGVQEINSSIASMDEMTQQNSALVEESTAAARTLSNQAAKLSELMAFFQLDGGRSPDQPLLSKAGTRARSFAEA